MGKLVHISGLIDLAMAPPASPPGAAPHPAMEWVPGGAFRMGANGFYPEEVPVRRAAVAGFWMDRHPVTNAAFATFVEATGYVTVAERAPDPAGPEPRVPGSAVFQPPRQRVHLRDPWAWWAYVPGASWRHPLGPGSTLDGLAEHPVVHVAWTDAAALAAWAGKEIPTEAEWELAARGGLNGRTYAWGDELAPGGRVMANTWQGEFPHFHRAGEGWTRTTPVSTYPPNGYGLYDLIGNVWEWTADEWGRHKRLYGGCVAAPTARRDRELARDSAGRAIHVVRKVLKGGSYLCAPNYCARYRPAARVAQRVDTPAGHQGFRCIVRVPAGAGGEGPAARPAR